MLIFINTIDVHILSIIVSVDAKKPNREWIEYACTEW